MNMKKFAALLLAALMVLTLAACGAASSSAAGAASGAAVTDDPQTTEEAAALYAKLMDQENALLSENTDLWDKVYLQANKGMAMVEDGKNYGDFLLDTIEAAKSEFSAEELEVLTKAAGEIRDIENQLTALEEKFPDCRQAYMNGGASVSPEEDSLQKFPAFEGKDLDGNTVNSDDLFSANAVTVVNFWFTACKPCVGELGDLDALNRELAEKGGALIGINTTTLNGDEASIAEAKEVLAKKGASYQNVYFDASGAAGAFIQNIFAYPTTYVVDRSGNIVGDPIMGAITEKNQAEALQKLIDQALAADAG
ncbi:MAG: TlpA family protein disulfide reductase [Subdoligranulum sp.]|nr:TlpA family protein disulfide reductase [Subdoligranulum sp.]